MYHVKRKNLINLSLLWDPFDRETTNNQLLTRATPSWNIPIISSLPTIFQEKLTPPLFATKDARVEKCSCQSYDTFPLRPSIIIEEEATSKKKKGEKKKRKRRKKSGRNQYENLKNGEWEAEYWLRATRGKRRKEKDETNKKQKEEEVDHRGETGNILTMGGILAAK